MGKAWFAAIASCCCTAALAIEPIPKQAYQYFPNIKLEAMQTLHGEIEPAILASQIEQETCISLKWKRCWSPSVENRQDNELGFGLAQVTIKYKNGKEVMNRFDDLKKLDPMLAEWNWEDRYNPRYQLRALAVGDLKCLPFAFGAAGEERIAMALSCYNGGGGSKKKKNGLQWERIMCISTPGCDHNRWWGHVEFTSNKSRKTTKQYKKSYYDINREYVRNILQLRVGRYRAFDWAALPG